MGEVPVDERDLWEVANDYFLTSAPYALGGIFLWFIIAYFFNTIYTIFTLFHENVHSAFRA